MPSLSFLETALLQFRQIEDLIYSVFLLSFGYRLQRTTLKIKAMSKGIDNKSLLDQIKEDLVVP